MDQGNMKQPKTKPENYLQGLGKIVILSDFGREIQSETISYLADKDNTKAEKRELIQFKVILNQRQKPRSALKIARLTSAKDPLAELTHDFFGL